MMLSERQRNSVLSSAWELSGPRGARVINRQKPSSAAALKPGNEPSEIIPFIIPIHKIIPVIIPIYNTSYLGDLCTGSLLVFDFSSENKLLLCKVISEATSWFLGKLWFQAAAFFCLKEVLNCAFPTFFTFFGKGKNNNMA